MVRPPQIYFSISTTLLIRVISYAAFSLHMFFSFKRKEKKIGAVKMAQLLGALNVFSEHQSSIPTSTWQVAHNHPITIVLKDLIPS